MAAHIPTAGRGLDIRSLELLHSRLFLKTDITDGDTTQNASFDICSYVNVNMTNCRSIVKEYQTDHWFTPSSEVLLIVCYCIAMTLGVVGNTIVCYVVLKFKQLRQPRNILILNLSVCGIIMCVACMPFSLIRLTLKNWHLGEFMCRVSPTLQTIDVLVSTFSIVAIAVDRYSAIVCASRECLHKSIVHYCIALMWFVSLILCTPMLVFHEVHRVHADVPSSANMTLYTICMEVWPADIWKKLYTTGLLVVQFVIPLVIISCLHARICQFLRLRINGNPRTDREVSRVMREVKRHKRNMLLLSAVAVSFALAWLPLTILNTLADYDYNLFMDRNFNEAYAYCLLVAMCSACINPILYGWFNSNFRQAFVQVLCCQKNDCEDDVELATIKNDSYGNSHRPFHFYSSLSLGQHSKHINMSRSSQKNIHSKSSERSGKSVMARTSPLEKNGEQTTSYEKIDPR